MLMLVSFAHAITRNDSYIAGYAALKLDMPTLIVQGGVITLPSGASMRPIVAVDVKNFDENNWSNDVSARAGVQLNNLQVLGRKLRILAEYYKGFAPSGQFYTDKVEYYGVGAYFYFRWRNDVRPVSDTP